MNMFDKYECISNDGLYITWAQEIFQCPKCFNVVKVSALRSFQPDVNCKCEYPDHINIMKSIGVHPPPGYKFKNQ